MSDLQQFLLVRQYRFASVSAIELRRAFERAQRTVELGKDTQRKSRHTQNVGEIH
jgi:hypothetical protein